MNDPAAFRNYVRESNNRVRLRELHELHRIQVETFWGDSLADAAEALSVKWLDFGFHDTGWLLRVGRVHYRAMQTQKFALRIPTTTLT